MRKIIPNIAVKNCPRALEYYKEVFNCKVENVQLADGVEIFNGNDGKIVHSELIINKDCVLYLTDIFDEIKNESKINLVLDLDSEDEIQIIFNRLSIKGEIKLDIQKTFWGAYHAVVEDRYNILWSLNYIPVDTSNTTC